MATEFVELVRQQNVLHETKAEEYNRNHDHLMRNIAQEETK